MSLAFWPIDIGMHADTAVRTAGRRLRGRGRECCAIRVLACAGLSLETPRCVLASVQRTAATVDGVGADGPRAAGLAGQLLPET